MPPPTLTLAPRARRFARRQFERVAVEQAHHGTRLTEHSPLEGEPLPSPADCPHTVDVVLAVGASGTGEMPSVA
jgi:hypothetical protein